MHKQDRTNSLNQAPAEALSFCINPNLITFPFAVKYWCESEIARLASGYADDDEHRSLLVKKAAELAGKAVAAQYLWDLSCLDDRRKQVLAAAPKPMTKEQVRELADRLFNRKDSPWMANYYARLSPPDLKGGSESSQEHPASPDAQANQSETGN